MDHRVDSNSNLFGRFSLGELPARRPDGVRAGRRPRVRQPGRHLGCREQEPGDWLRPHPSRRPCWRTSASGGSATTSPCCRSTSAPRPAADRGHSRAEPRRHVHQRPAGAVHRRASAGFNAGSGLGVNRCNCPLDQDESQWQMVGNVTKIWSDHTIKFGVDVRRAHNLRVPSDSHRSGELTFNTDRTARPKRRWAGAGDVPAGRRHAPGAVREHQHRRARAAVAPLLLRAGHLAANAEADAQLRPAPGHHQPADGERAGQRRLARPRHGPHQRRRRRRRGPVRATPRTA